MKGNITQIPTSKPHVFAFTLSGELAQSDLVSMAETMLGEFERYSSVNMLLFFKDYEGVEMTSGAHSAVVKAQFKGLSKVDKYAVVGAPDIAAKMVGLSDLIMPIASASFSHDDADSAWAFVGAEPAQDPTPAAPV